MSATIASIEGKAIRDSRGVPTLSITVHGSDGSRGTFDVPSGASTGIHEAHELRDDDSRVGGVSNALSILEQQIAPALIGKELAAQKEVDDCLIRLDGTPNKSRLGGNTLIGISIACAKAAALSADKEVWDYLHAAYFDDGEPALPRLYANLVNGGKHAASGPAFQEYHVVPKTTDTAEAARIIGLVQAELGRMAAHDFGDVAIGDEGGYALPVTDIGVPLRMLAEASVGAGVREKVDFALDVAASSFWNAAGNVYDIGGRKCTASELSDIYRTLSSAYGLLSIEDPFHEDDFQSFAELRAALPSVMLVGDDLTTTNASRLTQAIEGGSIDALIIKPNQIGTLTETVGTMKLAHARGIKCIVSHRSGETMDDFIADLAYAAGAFGIKLGARGQEEREAKYARLEALEAMQRAL
jgi:enolase